MAQNYDLTQTGPELQARIDQVYPNRDAIEQETETREAQDETLEASLKEYTDTEQARAEAAEAQLQGNIDTEQARAETAEGALDTRVSTNEVDIDLLKSQYEALTQSDIIVGPLPSTGQPNKIYRVPGSTYYTDYMWANGGWVKLAEYSTLDGYVYKGVATPSGTPVQSAEAVFYFAIQPGTYTNYGGLVVTNTIAILKYNGTEWTKDDVITIDEEPTAGSDNLVKSGGVQNELALGAVYDVSAKNPTAGPNNDGKWESISALLSDANLNTLIPTAYRKGGMSIKFIQSSDNKYVQYRLMSDSFNTTVANWQGVDDEPTAGSNNLVKSGGVYESLYISYFIKNQAVQDHSDVMVNGVSLYNILRSIHYIRISGTAYNNKILSVGYLEYGELKSDDKRSYRIVFKEFNNSSWERSSIEVQNFDISPIVGNIYKLYVKNDNYEVEVIIDFSAYTFGNTYTLDGGFANSPKFVLNDKWLFLNENLAKKADVELVNTKANKKEVNLQFETIQANNFRYFVKNPTVEDISDTNINGVSLYAILRSILYINIQGFTKDYSNVTLGLGYIEYGELKSGNKRSFKVVLKEYNTNNSLWERSSIEVQNFDIQPLTGAIYRLYTKTSSFSIECIINYEFMTYGNAYTLDGAFTNIPKFIFNNVWVSEKEKDEKLNKLAGDFSCFRKRLQNSVDTYFVGKGGSSDVANYTCFDIYKSILSLKLYGFEDGLYGLRYIARGETETLKYRFIIIKYDEDSNTWTDSFDTGNMLALEQTQNNSLIVWDATVGNKHVVMEIDFNLTPSLGFYASLYANGAAPQYVIKQDCFVAKQSSETVADFIQDLPVSDGSTISSGYAYIDSTTYNVKVKQ